MTKTPTPVTIDDIEEIIQSKSSMIFPTQSDEVHQNIIDDGINEILTARGKEYGEFTSQAQITQSLKIMMRDAPNWDRLTSDKKEALEMIAHKIGRILNANANAELRDSWVDIEGYAHCVSRTLPRGKDNETV